MEHSIEWVVETYIRAWSEGEPGVRSQLLQACFAEGGRLVTLGREIRGRAALASEMASFRARQPSFRIFLTSVIDVGRTSFRFRGVVELPDGTQFENSDSGEVDSDGRILTIFTFAGPLKDCLPPRANGE